MLCLDVEARASPQEHGEKLIDVSHRGAGAHAFMLLPRRAALERRLSDGLAFLDKCRLLAKCDGDGVEQLTYLLEFLEPIHFNIDPFHLRMWMEASTSFATSAGAVALLLPRAPAKPPPPPLPAASLPAKLVRGPSREPSREHPRLVDAADPPQSNDARNSRGSTRGDPRIAVRPLAILEEDSEGESWRELSSEISINEIHGAFTESRHPRRRHMVGQLGGVVGRIGRGLGHAQRTVLREAAGLLPSGRRRQSAESNEPLREESSVHGSRGSLSGSLGSDFDLEEADQLTRTAAVFCREVSVSVLSSLNHSPTAVAKLQIKAFSLAAESAPATGMRASIDLQLQATHTHIYIQFCAVMETYRAHTHTHIYICRPRTSTAPWGCGSLYSSRRKSCSRCASRRGRSWARRPPRWRLASR